MKQKIFKEKYSLYEISYAKDEIRHNSVDEIIADLKQMIQDHPVIAYIDIFDQYQHTKKLNGEINPHICAAKNIVFCFGMELPAPEVLAVRPRSIGVCEMSDSYVINFMEAPNAQANQTMIEMIKSLKT
ncbi:DUF6858 family protein [Sedimenticola selenatireducens]|uniref:DUF302 domain-containing protein n=1 Tax=Sedimenticola selenatireducens TaxID=191960 RepID=A0A2N6CWU7_9GAMM|nr:hypothetical protein [Sedimenticola selenatireducens]PLX61748.1 MAG: hypothetical protein C0630_09430 [Sedimenticola selenatireducens]